LNSQAKDVVTISAQAVQVAATPADLVRYAMDNNVDMDQLERFYELQRKWEEDQAKKAYVVAMSAFKAEPLVIEKTKQVSMKLKEGGKIEFKHVELAGVVDAVVPAMALHGLSHRWDIHQSDKDRIITVDCIITHAGGHSEKVTMHGLPDDSGKKNAIQQVASTVTYLQRYTLMAACGVAAKNIDDDGNGGGDEQDEDSARIEADWLRAISNTPNLDALKATKQAMIDDYKGISNLPKSLSAAYNDRLHELKPSANA